MEEYIKVSAKTVEDAIIEASIQLGTSSDNIEYRVIEKETKGFLGIGAKKAVIEAKKKKTEEEDIIKEVFGNKKKEPSVKKETKKSEKVEKPVQKQEKNVKKQEIKKPEKELKKENKELKKEEKKETKDVIVINLKKDSKKDFTEKKKEAVKENKEKAEKTPKVPKTPVDPKEAEGRAEEFLKNLFTTMDMKVDIHAEYSDDNLNIELSGDDMGVLIGKRGQTLDSIQYLTSLVVNKGKSSYVRVKLDTENYRDRRKATLENLAKNIALKVKKTRRPVYLEPMNPYERRIIHSALQNDPYVTTHSEGEEPCRKVVVTLKKREKNYYQKKNVQEVKEETPQE